MGILVFYYLGSVSVLTKTDRIFSAEAKSTKCIGSKVNLDISSHVLGNITIYKGIKTI